MIDFEQDPPEVVEYERLRLQEQLNEAMGTPGFIDAPNADDAEH